VEKPSHFSEISTITYIKLTYLITYSLQKCLRFWNSATVNCLVNMPSIKFFEGILLITSNKSHFCICFASNKSYSVNSSSVCLPLNSFFGETKTCHLSVLIVLHLSLCSKNHFLEHLSFQAFSSNVITHFIILFYSPSLPLIYIR
jgi:hypothetical protein